MSAWETATLREVAESLDYGVTAAATWEPKGPKFLRITDIRNGSVDWDRVPWCKSNDRAINGSRLRPGDIVFARTGSTGNSLLIRDCPEDSVFASYLIRVRLNDSVDPSYMSHFLRTPDYWSQIASKSRGAIQSGVNASTLGGLKFPMAPLVDQRRIAKILDQAEALRAKRREALARLDELAQSIFLDMFGDPVTNPVGWPRIPVRELGKVVTGNTPARTEAKYYGDYVEWIKSDNINGVDDYVTRAKEYLSQEGITLARTAPAGSILVTCIAGSPNSIGNVAMVDREVAFNQQINAFIPTSQNNQFLYMQFVTGKRLIRGASTGGMKGLVSKSRFEEITLIIPPGDLQEEFSCRVEAVKRLKASQRAHLAELDALFASLQYQAFRGEL